MKRLFLDESGDCSFSQNSRCKHFIITVISIDPQVAIVVKRRLKRQFAKFIKTGWPKQKEVKSHALFVDRRFGAKAMETIINLLTSVPTLEISYIVINKDGITNEPFRNAPYGTAYNYFAGILLSEMVFQDKMYDIHLIYDIRNKETHPKKHFKEYLEAKICEKSLENNVDTSISIVGSPSHEVYGLLAVDYFSWALYRKFEYGDDRFSKIFKNKLKRVRKWYL